MVKFRNNPAYDAHQIIAFVMFLWDTEHDETFILWLRVDWCLWYFVVFFFSRNFSETIKNMFFYLKFEAQHFFFFFGDFKYSPVKMNEKSFFFGSFVAKIVEITL